MDPFTLAMSFLVLCVLAVALAATMIVVLPNRIVKVPVHEAVSMVSANKDRPNSLSEWDSKVRIWATILIWLQPRRSSFDGRERNYGRLPKVVRVSRGREQLVPVLGLRRWSCRASALRFGSRPLDRPHLDLHHAGTDYGR